MLKVLSYILCDLDPKVNVIGQKVCICDGVPSTSALLILLNLVTLLNTIMCSSFRMAHIASCLQELLPFVNDNSLFIRIWQKQGHPCPMDTFLVFN